MDRPRHRWVRSLLVVGIGAAGAFVAFGPAADAATGVTGTVAVGSGALNVRTGASTSASRVSTLSDGTAITVTCQQVGQKVVGRARTTDRWDRLSDGTYVSDAYVRRGRDIVLCSNTDTPSSNQLPPIKAVTVPTRGWVTPVSYGSVSAYRTAARPTHDGVDLGAPRNTPIRATAAGRVVTVTCNTSGPSCDVDGSPQIRGCGWYVEVRHQGDFVTRYCHMVRRPEVNVDDQVRAGQVIGYVGTSGSSSGPHLHFEVHTGYPAVRANAVDPVDFMRRAGAALR